MSARRGGAREAVPALLVAAAGIGLVLAGCGRPGTRIGAASSGLGNPCGPQVEAEMTRLGVTNAMVGQITFTPRIAGGSNRTFTREPNGHTVWFDLNACRGSLVLDLARTCRVRQAYTTGDCQVAGVRPSPL